MRKRSYSVGEGSIVHPDAWIADGVRIGRFCLIERDCRLGENTTLGDFCKLLPGSWLGKRCKVDDYANTSGAVVVGDDVMVKRMACVTQGTIVEDKAFLGPGIMIIHEKHVSWQREAPKVSHGVRIGAGAVIGGRATLNAGVDVGANAHVGANALVTKDCQPRGVYVGVPARFVGLVEDAACVPLPDRPLRAFDERIRTEYLPELVAVGAIPF